MPVKFFGQAFSINPFQYFGYRPFYVFGKQAVEKSLVNIKNGVAGAKPPYRSSAICATASCSGFVWLTASILAWSRGGSPSNIAPSRGKGVFGKDAEIRTHQALHEAKLSECPKGDRDRGFALSYKNRLFLQAGQTGLPLLVSLFAFYPRNKPVLFIVHLL